MPIVAREPESTYIPAPAGIHQAVCCDVVDLGFLESPWGPKYKIQIRWFIEEEMPADKQADGVPYYMVTQRYTLTLDQRSNLRKHLQAWRGKPFSDEELKGFDVEKLLGANCQILVTHNEKEGKTYANVEAITPLKKGMEKMAVPSAYVRAKDRPDYRRPVTELPQETSSETDWPDSDYNDAPPHDDSDVPLPF